MLVQATGCLMGDPSFFPSFFFFFHLLLLNVTTMHKMGTKRNTKLWPHCTNFTMTYGDKLVSDQYSFLKTSYAYYAQRGVDISYDELILQLGHLHLVTLQPLHLPLVPVCLCTAYANFPSCFTFVYFSGMVLCSYSNESITFLLEDSIADLVV